MNPRRRGFLPRHLAYRCLSYFGIKEPPVDPAVILRLLDIRVHVEPLPCDGFTFRDAHGLQVVVSSYSPPARLNFTLAHELGHISMGHVPKDGRTTLSGMPFHCEYDANRFAAELLVPKAMLIKAYAIYAYRDLPNVFQVSEAVIALRMKEVGLADKTEWISGRREWSMTRRG